MPNREHWKAMLPIIHAYVAGNDIDVKLVPDGHWVTSPSDAEFSFHNPSEHYRIAKRDWAWACEQMTAGHEVSASHMGTRTLRVVGGVLSSRVEARDLLATDYRIVRKESD